MAVLVQTGAQGTGVVQNIVAADQSVIEIPVANLKLTPPELYLHADPFHP